MQYDVSKAILTASLFFAVFSAGKTSVYAFLTVFLRHLGVSPFQAGLLRCLQTLIGGIVAPGVLYCTGLCAPKKLPMIVCIFLTMGTYFILLFVSLPKYSCFYHKPALCDASIFVKNYSTSHSQSSFITLPLNVTPPQLKSTNSFPTNAPTIEITNTQMIQTETETDTYGAEFDITTKPINYYEQLPNHYIPPKIDVYRNIPEKLPRRYPNMVWLRNFYQARYPKRVKRNINDSIFNNLPSVALENENLYSSEGLWPVKTNFGCFLIIAIILLLGEIFCSPIEKLASTAWFSYLDEIDYTESHRRHTSYIPITTSIVVFLIGLLNLYYCYMTHGIPFGSYHFNFYIFGCLLGITLVTVSFFPQPFHSVVNYRIKNLTLPTGQPIYYYGDISYIIRYFFGTSTSFLLVITTLVNGILYACAHDFVPWYIEDMGGSQFAVSCAIALAYFSDAVGKFLVTKMQRHMSRNGLVILGIVTYGVRFIFFTALSTSWGVVFTQIVHCFSSVLFWNGVFLHVKRSYDDKKEQEVLLVLSSFHYVGYSIGTVLSGILYNMYKPLILFWSMSGVAFVWGLIMFTCFFACRVKPQRRRLSIDDATNAENVTLFSVDSSDEMEAGT